MEKAAKRLRLDHNTVPISMQNSAIVPQLRNMPHSDIKRDGRPSSAILLKVELFNHYEKPSEWLKVVNICGEICPDRKA